MRNSTYVPLLVIVLILISGCQMGEAGITATPVNLPASTSPVPFVTSTQIESAFPTLNSTITPVPVSTITPTPTATDRFPSESGMVFQCLDTLSTPPSDLTSSGIVALESRETVNGRSTGDLILLNMATMTTSVAIGEERFALYTTVSPDRTLIAYHNVKSDSLDIATADGFVVDSFPWETGWVRIPGWLDNEHIVINIAGLDPLEDTLRKPAHLLVIDLTTREKIVLAPDYPDIHTFDRFDWADWSRTMYDPTLTRVVYLTEYDDFSFVLWDLEKQLEITRLPAVFPMWNYIPIPRWSQDGSYFVVEAWIPEENRLELFKTSRDGGKEQLTNLYEYGEATLTGLSWSPDGRYLAGWLDTSLGEEPELELITIDTVTKQITNYCLNVTYIVDMFSIDPFEPIWSPDGTQLLVMDLLTQDDRRVILIDLFKGYAVPIAEDMEPVGWLLPP